MNMNLKNKIAAIAAASAITVLPLELKAEPITLSVLAAQAATTAVTTATAAIVHNTLKSCRLTRARIEVGAFGAKWGETDTLRLICD